MRLRFVIALCLLALAVGTAQATSWAGARARVARSRADMRTLTVALEAYRADLGTYPPSSASPEWQISERLLLAPGVTMISLPPDPFRLLTNVPPHPEWVYQLRRALLFLGVWLILTASIYSLFLLVNLAVKGRRRWREMRKGRVVEAAVLGGVLALVIICADPIQHPHRYRLYPNQDYEGRPHGYGYWTDGAQWLLQGLGPDGERTLDDLSAVPLTASPEANLRWLTPFTYDPTNGTASAGDVFRLSE